MPLGKWLDELASLVGKACPRLGAQGPALSSEVPPVGTPGRRRNNPLQADRAPADRVTCAPASMRREPEKTPGLPSRYM
jgi:hypothetical protein